MSRQEWGDVVSRGASSCLWPHFVLCFRLPVATCDVIGFAFLVSSFPLSPLSPAYDLRLVLDGPTFLDCTLARRHTSSLVSIGTTWQRA
ncbi:hypothetical protein C8R47DRAFT_104778 [Mycena vitilis]|nr:hypothetical protein C8R47DRAFT_104778 [Mycena vitilis]